MTWAFSTYLLMKGFKNLFKQYNIDITMFDAIVTGFIIALIVAIGLMIHLKRKSFILKNSKKAINHLFNVPLVFAVALLSFAH